MQDFIGYIVKECVKHGVALNLYPTEYHEDYSGYWDDEERSLTVATANKNWIEVLAHEFGHFQQWKERKFSDGVYQEAYAVFDEWLAGRARLPPEKVTELVTAMQECEMDAERRAHRLLRRFEVKVNLDHYIQKSNAYILFHIVMAKHRQWCDKESPSRVKGIITMMPTKFITDFSTLPHGFEDLILENCFDPKPWRTRLRHWLR